MSNIYELADTWNDAGTTFTGIGYDVTNTASAAASRLMRMKVGGVQKMSMYIDGSIGIGTDVFGTLGGIDWPGKQLNIADNTQAGIGLTTDGGYAALFFVDESATANNKGFTADIRQGLEVFRIASVLDNGNLNKTCATWDTAGRMGVGPLAIAPRTSLDVQGPHVADKGLAYFDGGSDGAFVGINGAAGQLAGFLINEAGVTKWIVYRNSSNALIFGSTNNGDPRLTLALTNGTTFADSIISMAALPTSDPAVAGRLWKNSNVVTVSAG